MRIIDYFLVFGGCVLVILSILAATLGWQVTPLLQSQITVGAIGVAIASFGYHELNRAKEPKGMDQILTKLNEIQQDMKEQMQQEGSHSQVADTLKASLEYYIDHLIKQNAEEDNEKRSH